MKIYKKIAKIVLATTMCAGIISCETTELEILDSPDALAPDRADVDFYLNQVLIQSSVVYEYLSENTQELTRLRVMPSTIYSSAYPASDFNNTQAYEIGYTSVLAEARALRPLAEEKELFTHVAISKIMEAYMMLNYVDLFGPMPYSESFSNEFRNPNLDSGEDIYAAVEVLLEEAKEDLAKDELRVPEDLFYDGDETKWLKVANTLLLKMYVQTRLVSDNTSKINNIVAEGDYITNIADDFEFPYSSTDTNPDSRHPEFGINYDVAADVSTYMSNSYMYYLAFEKGFSDPRTRYYFYNQSSTITDDTQELECLVEEAPNHYDLDFYPFCYAANYNGSLNPDAPYWGRDHGNSDGLPPDSGVRTTYGVYPVGGKFDAGQGTANEGRSIGLQGAGIAPYMLASYVDFMLAEAALTEGITGDPKEYLENGIRKSINKVIDFGAPAVTDEDLIPSEEDIDNYVAFVLNAYESAATEDEKLEIIVKEYFIALWGNGIEAYNTYRRTGKPGKLQPTLVIPNGGFVRSFLYPTNMVDQNSNIEQKPDHTVKVFWDTNSTSID